MHHHNRVKGYSGISIQMKIATIRLGQANYLQQNQYFFHQFKLQDSQDARE